MPRKLRGCDARARAGCFPDAGPRFGLRYSAAMIAAERSVSAAALTPKFVVFKCRLDAACGPVLNDLVLVLGEFRDGAVRPDLAELGAPYAILSETFTEFHSHVLPLSEEKA